MPKGIYIRTAAYREKLMGYTHSPEARRKMSEAHKGKRRSKEHRQRMSESQRGEKSHRWKGGKTLLQVSIRNSFKYRQWRSDVFTRDNFTCQTCGQRGHQLEADHYPKGFANILDEYQIKTLEEARNCEELWNINNGRTLCRNCHRPHRHQEN